MELIQQNVSHPDSTHKQLQFLTLAPQTCSRELLSEFFDVSEYLIRESREVFKKNGILGEIPSKRYSFLKLTILIKVFSEI